MKISTVGLTVGLIALVAGRGTAQAQQRDPRELEAKTACLAGRAQHGIELLAQLYAETNDPTYIYNQGRCFEQDGKPREAITRFREYLRKSPGIGAQENAQVQAHIAELDAQLKQGTAAPLAPAAPPVPPMALPATGTMATPASAPVSQGASSDVAASSDSSRVLRIAGVSAAGVGVLGFVFAIYMHGRAVSLSQEVTAAAKTTPTNTAHYDGTKYDDGKRAETLQWVGYAVGTAALIAGGAMYYLGSRHEGEGEGAVTVTAMPDFNGARAALRIVF